MFLCVVCAHVFVYLYVCLSVCLSASRSICLCVYVCVSVYLSTCLSRCLSVCLSICQSICQSFHVCLSFCLIYQSLSTFLNSRLACPSCIQSPPRLSSPPTTHGQWSSPQLTRRPSGSVPPLLSTATTGAPSAAI